LLSFIDEINRSTACSTLPLLALYFRAEVVDSYSRFHFLSEKPRAPISTQVAFTFDTDAIYNIIAGGDNDTGVAFRNFKKWCCFIHGTMFSVFIIQKKASMFNSRFKKGLKLNIELLLWVYINIYFYNEI